ncbi:MAG: E3 binding domain-containing protein, partial [Anaerolineae bacterium]|nr:E3 binding domain-containing protein [Anaerolineae bacterium]
MAYEVLLPKLGQTVEESRIVEWLKAEGDPVERGEVLFTVETDKAVLDVEATRKGYLRRILAHAGEMLPVLAVVGLITRTPDEPLEAEGAEIAPAAATATSAPVPVEAGPAGAEAMEAPKAGPAGRVFSSPRARKTATERGVEVGAVSGTGPGGRVIERDVLAYL